MAFTLFAASLQATYLDARVSKVDEQRYWQSAYISFRYGLGNMDVLQLALNGFELNEDYILHDDVNAVSAEQSALVFDAVFPFFFSFQAA
jgi:hypothetical protein